jgi:integrase
MKAIRDQLKNPYRAIVHIAAVTGLRISELLGLKWMDVDFQAQEIHPARTVIDGNLGGLKTEASGKAIPIDKALRKALLDWRKIAPYNQDGDFLFGSMHEKGLQPLWPDTMLRKHLKPAVVRAGIAKRVGWHTFRHSYTTLLVRSGTDVKTAQDLLRHANSKTTMDMYAKSIPDARRKAQANVAVEIFGAKPKTGSGERKKRSLKFPLVALKPVFIGVGT